MSRPDRHHCPGLRAAADAGVPSVGIELTATYCDMSVDRLAQQAFDLASLGDVQ